jgi:hypothetical protein
MKKTNDNALSLYKLSEPYQIELWFKHDTLAAADGLDLTCGIRPRSREYGGEGREDLIELELVDGRKILWCPPDDSLFDTDTCRAALHYYDRTRDDLGAIWASGMHPPRNPIGYYLEWAKAKGFDVPWLDWALERGLITPGLTPFNSPLSHTTKLLQVAHTAILEHWESHDKAKPPKREAIIESLQHKGLTARQAAAIDLIIRPDELKFGGNRKR